MKVKCYSDKHLDKVISALIKGYNIAGDQEEIELINRGNSKPFGPWKKARIYFKTAIKYVIAAYKAKDRAKVRAKAKNRAKVKLTEAV